MIWSNLATACPVSASVGRAIPAAGGTPIELRERGAETGSEIAEGLGQRTLTGYHDVIEIIPGQTRR
jgi:hypothetical protein